jgi:hypothetical protein
MTTETAPDVGLERFENIFHSDFRQCDCEMPMVMKKWNDALGTFVAVRLCCMAKALERLTGQKLYEVYDFEPRWDWDCERIEECADPLGSGTFVYRQKGPPPRWLRERLVKKGRPIYNLKNEEK